MILHGAGYLTTAGVAVAELLEIPLGPRFGWTAGLLAAFGLILSFIFNTERARGKGGFLAAALAASAIGIAIMVVGATPIFGAILFFILCTIVGMRLSLGAAIAWVAGATSILQKIDARDRTQAALKARELGLLEE